MMYLRVSIEQLQQEHTQPYYAARRGNTTPGTASDQGEGGARIQFSQRLANLEVRLDWLQILQILCR